jgi:hypothetical protein
MEQRTEKKKENINNFMLKLLNNIIESFEFFVCIYKILNKDRYLPNTF